MRAGAHAGPMEPVRHGAVEDLVDERGLARARDAGHAAEHSKWERNVDRLEVVLAGAANAELAARLPALRRHGYLSLAAQELPGERAGLADDVRGRALGDDLPAVLPGAGP